MTIQFNPEGFFINFSQWSDDLALKQAQKLKIVLTEEHWMVIKALREFYQTYELIPNLRAFIKYLQKNLGHELGNSIKLHCLFSDTPMRSICFIAGLPKPKNCI